jgi:SAM-dependent methyltransferase
MIDMIHPHEQFNDQAQLYAAARPTYPPVLYEWLAKQCMEYDAAWDCATGNGQAAVALADYFQRVEASDVSANQLAAATLHPRVRYTRQEAEATDYPAASFDLVTVAAALHWFNFDCFWPEVRRVLKPGGVFAAWGYSWQSISPEIDAALKQHVLKVTAPYWASQNRLLWNDYRDVPFPFKRLDAPSFELKLDWTLDELFDYIHTWSATRRCMEAQGQDFFLMARQALTQIWGDPHKKRQVRMKLCLIAGRGTYIRVR